MKLNLNKKIVLIITIVIIVILSIFVIQQLLVLQKAHSTFNNYYIFRECVQLLEKTDVSGVCKTKSGSIITIVKIDNKWYLKGDGPGVW